jgi:hypothetical protein
MNQNSQACHADNPTRVLIDPAKLSADSTNALPLIGRRVPLLRLNGQPVQNMKPISVLFSTTLRERLARISQKSGLSPETIVRHAVKKQLPLWEANGHNSGKGASKSTGKLVGPGVRQKSKPEKPNASKT